MKKRRVKVFILILILALAWIISKNVLFKRDKEDIEVEVSKVKRGEIKEIISCKGEITSSNLQEIRIDMDGFVEDVCVKEGDEVKKGDALCIIKDPDEKELFNIKQSLQSSIMDYEIEKERLKKARETYNRNIESTSLDLEEAERDLERYKRLYLEGAISKRELDDVEKSLKKARLQYEEAKDSSIIKDSEIQVKKADIQLEKAKRELISFYNRVRPKDRIDLSKDIGILKRELQEVYSRLKIGEIISPIDGSVLEVGIRKGAIIKKGGGKNIHFKIADLKSPIIELLVPEYDIRKVKIGQDVEIRSKGLDKVLRGHIDEIKGEIKKGRFIHVKCKIDDLGGNKIILGSSIEGKIITSHLKDVLRVPIEAVLESEGGKVVYVVRDKKACITSVKVGICGKEYIEIKDGLKEGDMVITIGNLDVKDGGRVKIVEKRYEENVDFYEGLIY